MAKILTFLPIFLSLIPVMGHAAMAPARGNITNYASPSNAPRAQASDFVSQSTYNALYPVMNNKMRVDLSNGTTPNETTNPISTLVRTYDTPSSGRRVVSRSGGTGARVASTAAVAPTTARAGALGGAAGTTNSVAQRRVVSRGNNATVRSAATGRGDATYTNPNQTTNANASSQNNIVSISADRCLADYTQCMNGYCQRQNTAYNRCYCSSKLAQIDAEYQPAIDKLIRQILELKNGSDIWTAEEMNKYWESTVGKYTGDNSWKNLDDALDIDWSDTQSRVRGQQAFVTGHDYCVQHLRSCAYMANNLRDAYRSDIARDCQSYENSLQKIKAVAESLVESFND